MSEKQEHRRRREEKLRYLTELTKWLDREPPMWRIFLHKQWKKERPVLGVDG